MDHKVFSASIRCDDYAEMLVFDRCIWKDSDEFIQFSIADSFISGNEYRGLFGRLRRAWRAFWSKPIYYADIIVHDKNRAKVFLNECLSIIEKI